MFYNFYDRALGAVRPLTLPDHCIIGPLRCKTIRYE